MTEKTFILTGPKELFDALDIIRRTAFKEAEQSNGLGWIRGDNIKLTVSIEYNPKNK